MNTWRYAMRYREEFRNSKDLERLAQMCMYVYGGMPKHVLHV